MATDVTAFVNCRFTVGPGSSCGRSLISSRTSSANCRAPSFSRSDCSDTTGPLHKQGQPQAVSAAPITQLPNHPITKSRIASFLFRRLHISFDDVNDHVIRSPFVLDEVDSKAHHQECLLAERSHLLFVLAAHVDRK